MSDIRKYINLIESVENNKVQLVPDLYDDEDEVYDESEILGSFIDEDDLERYFTVQIMSPDDAMKLTTARNDDTVWDSFNDHATKGNTRVVKDKIDSWDDDRIVVMNNTLLDDNHHVIAGITSKRNIKYIDLAE